MRLIALFLLIVLASPAIGQDTIISSRRVVIVTAQEAAEDMARIGVLRHCGRAAGRREGVGVGPTPEAALRACCFYGRYKIVEKGVAWSPTRRQWFAVIRYAE